MCVQFYEVILDMLGFACLFLEEYWEVYGTKKKEEKEIHLYYAEFCIHCYFILWYFCILCYEYCTIELNRLDNFVSVPVWNGAETGMASEQNVWHWGFPLKSRGTVPGIWGVWAASTGKISGESWVTVGWLVLCQSYCPLYRMILIPSLKSMSELRSDFESVINQFIIELFTSLAEILGSH